MSTNMHVAIYSMYATSGCLKLSVHQKVQTGWSRIKRVIKMDGPKHFKHTLLCCILTCHLAFTLSEAQENASSCIDLG